MSDKIRGRPQKQSSSLGTSGLSNKKPLKSRGSKKPARAPKELSPTEMQLSDSSILIQLNRVVQITQAKLQLKRGIAGEKSICGIRTAEKADLCHLFPLKGSIKPSRASRPDTLQKVYRVMEPYLPGRDVKSHFQHKVSDHLKPGRANSIFDLTFIKDALAPVLAQMIQNPQKLSAELKTSIEGLSLQKATDLLLREVSKRVDCLMRPKTKKLLNKSQVLDILAECQNKPTLHKEPQEEEFLGKRKDPGVGGESEIEFMSTTIGEPKDIPDLSEPTQQKESFLGGFESGLQPSSAGPGLFNETLIDLGYASFEKSRALEDNIFKFSCQLESSFSLESDKLAKNELLSLDYKHNIGEWSFDNGESI